MGLKKRNRVSAEFSMSSLTDIIFLLLIFFMLSSSLVAPNALNLKLPGSSRTKIPSGQKMDDVRITASGNYYLNGKRIDISDLEKALRRRVSRVSGKMNMTISPAKSAKVEDVVAVMDIARRLEINGILAADK